MSVETMEEAIRRNTFSRKGTDDGIISGGFSPDKVLRVLLNSERDIEEETRDMVFRMRDIYETEDQIALVRRCLHQMPARDEHLLTEAYIDDVRIDYLEEEMSLSRGYIYKLLRKAMKRLLAAYNEECRKVENSKADRLIKEVSPLMPGGSIA